jgi:hypothetical protein
MNLSTRVALIGLTRTLKVMGIATAVLAAAEGVQWAICFVDARRKG